MSSTAWNNVPTDRASIDANRSGHFTSWQHQHLKEGSELWFWVLSAMFAALFSFLLVAPVVAGVLDSPSYFRWEGLSGVLLVLALPVLLVLTRGLLSFLCLRRDLAQGAIMQADGQVTFLARHGSVAQAAGEPLSGIDDGKAVGLVPGMYRFWYLPRSRRVLSAEQQTLFEPGASRADLQAALARANGFRLEDLERNRLGWISTRQRTVLVRQMLGLLVSTVAVVSGAVWQLPLLIQSSPWGYLLLAAVLAGLIFPARRRWLEVREGRVAALEGEVQPEEVDWDGVSYAYVLDQQRFRVDSVAYRVLIPGRRYRLYYLPRGKQLVSIEPLPWPTPRGCDTLDASVR
jgi:hypothetical protein